jgi:hypothetical protein
MLTAFLYGCVGLLFCTQGFEVFDYMTAVTSERATQQDVWLIRMPKGMDVQLLDGMNLDLPDAARASQEVHCPQDKE